VDWKGLKDVDQINMDSTSSLHGSSFHRPSTEVRFSAWLPPLPKTSGINVPQDSGCLIFTFSSYIPWQHPKYSLRLTVLHSISPCVPENTHQTFHTETLRRACFTLHTCRSPSEEGRVAFLPARVQDTIPFAFSYSKREPISPGMASM
jgi:hypothetical protein